MDKCFDLTKKCFHSYHCRNNLFAFEIENYHKFTKCTFQSSVIGIGYQYNKNVVTECDNDNNYDDDVDNDYVDEEDDNGDGEFGHDDGGGGNNDEDVENDVDKNDVDDDDNCGECNHDYDNGIDDYNSYGDRTFKVLRTS